MRDLQKEVFEYAAEEWLFSIKEKVSPSTYRRYENVIQKHLFPRFSDQKMEEITMGDIESFAKEEQQNGVGIPTLRMIFFIMKNILLFSGIIVPAKTTFDFHEDKSKGEIQVMDAVHIDILERYLLSEVSENTLMVLLSLKMGLQLSEICGLRWCDLDMEKHRLYVRRMVQRFPAQNSIKKTELVLIPAGAAREREIPIPDILMDRLDIIQKKQYEKMRKAENEKMQEMLFVVTGKLKLPDPRTMQYRFHKILNSLQLPDYKFLVLRDSFAYHCLDMGMDMELLSRLMGHGSLVTTAGRYQGGVKENWKEQMRKFMAG